MHRGFADESREARGEGLCAAYGALTALQQAGVFFANIAAGYVNDAGGASATNPAGYASMLWFFGLLSLAAFVFAALLWRRSGNATPR